MAGWQAGGGHNRVVWAAIEGVSALGWRNLNGIERGRYTNQWIVIEVANPRLTQQLATQTLNDRARNIAPEFRLLRYSEMRRSHQSAPPRSWAPLPPCSIAISPRSRSRDVITRL